MTRLPLAALALAILAPSVLAQAEPEDSWMIHMDGSGDALRFVPDKFAVVPGGIVQLMIFGSDHGKYSLVLEGARTYEAEVDTAEPGVVHVAEFAAPSTPGDHAFFDKHHPGARGVLTVARAAASAPSIGVGNGYDTRFYPDRLEVAAGSTFTFRNNASEIIHTLTAEAGSFDADAVRAGESRALTAPTKPGEYTFVCKYHQDAGMRGVLVVTQAEADAEAAAEARSDTPGVGLVAVLALLGAIAVAGRKRR